jgi:hypothetical protein
VVVEAARPVIVEKTKIPHTFDKKAGQDIVKAEGPSVSVRAIDFVDGPINQLATSPDGKQRLEGVTSPDRREISAEVVSALEGFTEFYVQKLIDMKKETVTIGGKQTTRFEAMKTEQVSGARGMGYLEDDALIRSFTNNDEKNLQIKTKEEINSLILKHPEMMQNLMVIAERYARDALAAAGLRAEMGPRGVRTNLDTLDRRIDFPIDQGEARKVGNRITDWLRAPHLRGGRDLGHDNQQNTEVSLTEGTVASVLSGFATTVASGGNIEATAVGMVLGPVIAAGIQRLTREGVSLSFVLDDDVADQAARRREETRSRYMLGINPNDIELSTQLGDALKSAVSIIYLRAEYMRSLGVPPEKLDALGEQFITNPEDGIIPEDINVKMVNRIQLRFQDLVARRGGIDTATFDLQRDLYRRAQEEILIENFEQLTDKERLANASDRSPELDKAISGRQTGGEIVKARTQEQTERIELLNADKSMVEGLDPKLKAYLEKTLAAQADRDAVTQYLNRMLVGAGAAPGDIVAALTALRRLSVTGGTDVTIPEGNAGVITLASFFDREAIIQTQIDTAITGIVRLPTDTERSYNARVDEARPLILARFKPQLDEIARQKTLVAKTIQDLTDFQEKADKAGETALSLSEVRDGAREVSDMQDSLRRVEGLGFSENVLTGQSFNQNMEDANAANAIDPNFGWPETDNREMSQVLRKATIQARANSATRVKPAATVGTEVDFDAVLAGGLKMEQLVSQATAELLPIYQLSVPAGTLVQVENAQRWARAQLRDLQTSAITEADNIKRAVGVEESAVRSVDLEDQIDQLKMAKTIYEDRDNVQSRIHETYSDLEKRRRLGETGFAFAGTDGYTESEENSHLPRNVLEVLHILTGYQNSGNRNEAFRKIWENFGSNPDTRLIPILCRAFDIAHPIPAIGPAQPLDAAFLSTELQRRLNLRTRNRLNESDLRRAIGVRTIDQIIDWTLSL